ncbi:hypothetical protein B1778_00320 [Dehalococcoides mccartyi]|nr:hypothetical protein B1777_00465 [Dehalococcoides mccartyi]AQU06677.1 hypothetical protein B1778_00320 [Dehalococcoides mccartyi]
MECSPKQNTDFRIKTRKFGDNQYVLFDWCAELDEARLEVKELRDNGKFVRYSRNSDGYSIWMRE